IRRPRQRYGPANGRGRRGPFVPKWAGERNARKPEPARWYTVPAGTHCHVRRMGEKTWREHRTRRPLRCHGFLWRNETHYGFAHGQWEVKVEVGRFREGRP